MIKFFENSIGSSFGRAGKLGARSLQQKLEKSRDFFLRNSEWTKAPSSKTLILIADAKIIRIKDVWYTIYCKLVRSPDEKEAVILPPVILDGLETQYGWEIALDDTDDDVLSRIKAVVSDGHVGIMNFAKRRSWVIQRCHFHIRAAIQHRRSRWKQAKFPIEGMRVWTHVNAVLLDQKVVIPHLKELAKIIHETSSKELKSILRGFILHHDHFRSYMKYSELNLPTTSNTAESTIGSISALLFKMRGLSSLTSLKKWIFALLKFRRTTKCKGTHQPN